MQRTKDAGVEEHTPVKLDIENPDDVSALDLVAALNTALAKIDDRISRSAQSVKSEVDTNIANNQAQTFNYQVEEFKKSHPLFEKVMEDKEKYQGLFDDTNIFVTQGKPLDQDWEKALKSNEIVEETAYLAEQEASSDDPQQKATTSNMSSISTLEQVSKAGDLNLKTPHETVEDAISKNLDSMISETGAEELGLSGVNVS